MSKRGEGRDSAWEAGLKWGLAVFWFGVPVAVFIFLGWTYVQYNRKKHERNRVQSSAQNLRNAIKQFHLQYHTYAPLSEELPGIDFSVSSDEPLMEILSGIDSEKNPRQVVFGEWTEDGNATVESSFFFWLDDEEERKTGLVDNWGNHFRIHVDSDGDHRLADPENPGRTLRQSIIVYSAGPDGDYSSWEDNVKTW